MRSRLLFVNKAATLKAEWQPLSKILLSTAGTTTCHLEAKSHFTTMSHLPVLLIPCFFVGTQLREQRGTIKQFTLCQLNTSGFPGRKVCPAGWHTHSTALETWFLGVPHRTVSYSPRQASQRGHWQPGCLAYTIFSSQTGQANISPKLKPTGPAFLLCLALTQDIWKQRPPPSELEGS